MNISEDPNLIFQLIGEKFAKEVEYNNLYKVSVTHNVYLTWPPYVAKQGRRCVDPYIIHTSYTECIG